MIDAALRTRDPHMALLACAHRGVPGPVIVADEGCAGHIHATCWGDEAATLAKLRTWHVVCAIERVT